MYRSTSAAIAIVWYYAPYCATVRGPRVEIMSCIVPLPVAISAERSTYRLYKFDMCIKTRIFTHESNTCVIRRLMLRNLGFVDQLSCTPLPATLLQPRIAEFWFVHETQNLEIAPPWLALSQARIVIWIHALEWSSRGTFSSRRRVSGIQSISPALAATAGHGRTLLNQDLKPKDSLFLKID